MMDWWVHRGGPRTLSVTVNGEGRINMNRRGVGVPFLIACVVSVVLAIGYTQLGHVSRVGASALLQASTCTTITATVGTVTITPVGTGTATPCPTTAPATNTPLPLAASPILVTNFTALRRGSLLTFRWHMAVQNGVRGFRIFARRVQLTNHLIHPHSGSAYRHQTRWNGSGPYSLHVLYTTGQVVTVKSG
jgi:hypothetical protein